MKAASNGGMKKATTIGLAMIAGALTYKFVVVPATAKFKNWRENRKTVGKRLNFRHGYKNPRPHFCNRSTLIIRI